MTCPKCGQENSAESRSCASCGSPLPATEQPADPPTGPARHQATRLAGVATAWWELLAYAGLMLVAGGMRLWDLGSRAMHHDESLHAFYAWNLYTGRGYQHDPMMHGPFQMEATAASFFIFGDSDYAARLIYVLAGIALVGLPFLFRARLGTLGSLLVSSMLAFSPVMLYFSRFARNDIIMAVWVLGLVICMWRYMDEGRNRYLYIGSALLALAFATKETAYIATSTLGLFLVWVVASRSWPAIRQGLVIGEVSTPNAIAHFVAGVWSGVGERLTLTGISRPAGFLVLLFSLSLPLGAALVSVLQDTPLMSWSGLVLASPIGGEGPTGAPLRGGLVIAFLVVVTLIGISAYVGYRWNWPVWWRCAAIFHGILVVLYSTFFTNVAVGVGSGVWRSLGYWLVQQGEARGGQPWYYYFVITPIYEFLPLLFAIAGGVYYMRRKDPFGRFLVFWAVTTFLLYSIASEKMPWLLVNVTLPLIVLSGKFLGDVIRGIQWRPLVSGGGLLLLVGVPVFLVLLWRLAFASVDAGEPYDILVLAVSLAALVALAFTGYRVAQRVGYRNFAAFALIPVAVVLLALTIRAGWYASYRNGDTPVEMIVYTQTSPDIVQLLRYVEREGNAIGGREQVPIAIDGTSGFTWPWAWYLRDYTSVRYGSFSGDAIQSFPDSSVLLVHSKNRGAAEPLLADGYSRGTRVKHRWWFPEGYRNLTLRKLLAGLVDRQAWRKAMGYFLYRRLDVPLGSEDAYVYFADEFPQGFSPLER